MPRCQAHLDLDRLHARLDELIESELHPSHPLVQQQLRRTKMAGMIVERRCYPVTFGHPCPEETEEEKAARLSQ